jgi:RHH-type rel operon transcriptional repressor/antitoxin RelB
MLALRLPKDIERRLEALAQRTGRSKSFYAREAILEHLDDLEAAYLSDEILKRVETGQEKTYTLDELDRFCGVWSPEEAAEMKTVLPDARTVDEELWK